MSPDFDVIIVGGGPAGLFCAWELSRSDLSVLILEKGDDINQRTNLTSGLGGAGAFSDGKLTLSPETGGHLKDYLGEEATCELIDYVDRLYLEFGAPSKIYGVGDEVEPLKRKAALSGLRLIPVPIRHLGTDRCRAILTKLKEDLGNNVSIAIETEARKVMVEEGTVKGVETGGGQRLSCRYLVLAPGREGASWLSQEARELGLSAENNPVDVGVRVEVPAPVMAPLTDVLYEAKLEYFSSSFDDRVRTFCMCPEGEVIVETTGGDDPVTTVNGQSYSTKKTPNTNFALLISSNFTKPFHEPIAYGKYLARLANMLSGGVLIQRLVDLKTGHRSTQERIERSIVQPTLPGATPGDLSFVLPYRHLTGILEMLDAMDKLAPGVTSRHTLLYGVEVKFYSYRLSLSSVLETEVGNLFAIGDGAGLTRGLVQASGSGVVVAREIMRRAK